MNKYLKWTLIGLGSLIVLLVIVAGIGYKVLSNRMFSFEDDYNEKDAVITEMTVDGVTFFDRNQNGRLDVYEDDRQPIEARVADVMAQMTLEEKIHLLKGSGLASAMGMVEGGIAGAVGTIVPTPRLGIPTVYLSDGPAGLRIQPTREGEDRTYYCTAFPIATLLASTWNVDLVGQVGSAMGNEALEYGIDVILGPGANLHRHPLCGRNFEYYSEDPVLTGEMGAAMVNGIESHGVGTSVKHYVANNQETQRNTNNAVISERALRELYLRGFEIIVKKSQPWTIMSSYNLVNGKYVAENPYLLTDVLRGDMGFEGLVMSDWFGGRDAVAMVNAGNDLLEPGTKPQWDALLEGAEDGSLNMEAVDTSVRRILELIFRSRKMQNYAYGNNPDLDAHAQVTRQSAAEGMVLLKNDGTLPLQDIRNIALIGVTSYDFIAGGTGSGDVNEAYTVSLEEGLTEAGFEINSAARAAFQSHKAANPEAFEKPKGLSAMTQPYDPPEMQLSADQLEECVSTADLAIVTIGRNSGEGGDRVEKDDFLLSAEEKEMLATTIDAFHAQGKKVVVVLNIGGVIETASWRDQPDAILLAWQGGQEGGNSVADILRGAVNPSGKLPMTFPVHLDDHAANANFPLEGGTMDLVSFLSQEGPKPESEWVRNQDVTYYEEGIYVGYRHFDKAGLEVSYPFGYGLSYTRFSHAGMATSLSSDTLTVRLTVTNEGDVAGKEVVQLYVGKPGSAVDRPERELKAFAKTPELAPGASVEVVMTVPVADFAYWDEGRAAWTVEPGTYQVQVGSSSRDLPLSQMVEI
ncbi:MAG: beta-glucosidase [Bacteroidetes bacterium]|nr:MAG: beta-glucosidase [Bacteroidota bacterium]